MSEKVNLTGQVQITEEVVASIASTAVLEAEGVAGMASHFTGDLAGRLSRKKPAKGVALQIKDGNVKISVEIVTRSGAKIQAVARDVQEKVKNAIETMTGFTANEVNVVVAGLVV